MSADPDPHNTFGVVYKLYLCIFALAVCAFLTDFLKTNNV